MNESLFHAGLLAMFVALSACGAATHPSTRIEARAAVPSETVSTTAGMWMPEPQAPFDTTPISPVESAGASPTP